MPRVNIERVVSFSSEDPEYSASGLVKGCTSDARGWRVQRGEVRGAVVLQLARAVRVASVSVGTVNAATLEVLAGRAEAPDTYEVLAPSCMLLSPSESRRVDSAASGAMHRVRSLTAAELTPAAEHCWDRLRIVLTQPYNKHVQFGISFVQVYSPEAPNTGSALPLALEAPSDDEEFQPGELFARRIQASTATTDPKATLNNGTDAQIRHATSQILKHIDAPSTKLKRTSISRPNATHTAKRHKRDSPTHSNNDSSDRRDKPALITLKHDTDTKEDNHNTTRDRSDLDKSNISTVPDTKPQKQHRTESLQNKDKNAKYDDKVSNDDQNKTNKNRNRTDHEHGRSKASDTVPTRDRKASRTESKPDYIKDGASASSANSGGNAPSGGSQRAARSGGNSPSGGSQRAASSGGNSPSGGSQRAASSGGNSPSGGSQRAASSGGNAPSGGSQGHSSGGKVPPYGSQGILQGVVFVLSGYEHPRRGAVRRTAEAHGARCRRDWDTHCTHLICAFPNTPKLRHVRSSPNGPAARVVTADWVEASVAAQRQLPWRWYATESGERLTPPRDHRPTSEEGDTDDEIERVMQKKAKAVKQNESKDSTPRKHRNKSKNKQNENSNDFDNTIDYSPMDAESSEQDKTIPSTDIGEGCEKDKTIPSTDIGEGCEQDKTIPNADIGEGCEQDKTIPSTDIGEGCEQDKTIPNTDIGEGCEQDKTIPNTDIGEGCEQDKTIPSTDIGEGCQSKTNQQSTDEVDDSDDSAYLCDTRPVSPVCGARRAGQSALCPSLEGVVLGGRGLSEREGGRMGRVVRAHGGQWIQEAAIAGGSEPGHWVDAAWVRAHATDH